jgi:hypothetical protein
MKEMVPLEEEEWGAVGCHLVPEREVELMGCHPLGTVEAHLIHPVMVQTTTMEMTCQAIIII